MTNDLTKPMGFMMVAVAAPVYAGLFVALLMPRYAVYALASGLVLTVVSIFAIVMWTALKFQGWQNVGLTLQHADGLDEYRDVLYTEPQRDLGHDGQHYRYSVRAVDGTEWLFMMDHPIDEVIPRYEKVPVGAFMPSIPTRFMTGVLLQEAEVQLHPDDVKPTLAQKVLRRKPKEARIVKDVYVYGTPAAIKRRNGIPPGADGGGISVPDKEAAKALYGAWFDTEYNELKAELNSVRQDLKDAMEMLDNRLPIMLRVRKAMIEERHTDWGKIAKWAAVAAVAVFAAYVVAVALGVL